MDPFVVEMHSRSGLLDQIKTSTISLEQAGAETLAFIKQHVPEARTVPLCGNSIGTDRRFLAAYLPEIEEYLHYRSVDVSSIKELVRRWYPEVLTQRGWKQGAHRALDDIRESISELQLYRSLVFSTPDEVANRLEQLERSRLPSPIPKRNLQRLPEERGHRSSPVDRRSRHTGRMRAVVVTEYGGPEVLTVTEVPDPVPGPDEILVRVAHSACNRADTLQRMGGYRDPVARQHEILGLEYAGTVAAVGERVTLWAIGDRVMGIESGACYAELVATHERQALPIPSAVELSDAAAIPEVFLTAWDALVVQGGLTSGRWALVHAGASGVGTAAIQIAKAIGARIAVTCSAGKIQACRDLGADLVLERSPADWAAALREAAPGGVDVILDVIGGEETNRNLASIKPQGAIVQVGLMGGGQTACQPRVVAGQAGALDRHHAAGPPDRAESGAQPALHRRDDPALRVGCSCVP